MIFLDALKGKNQGRPPLWLMRQAGRYMPEYRALRERVSLWELFHNSELAAEVTLLPIKRFGFDAAIVFSDILVIAEAFGLTLSFPEGKGPQVHPRLETARDIENLQQRPIVETLGFVKRTIELLKPALNVPLIGFCGGPFTVASYMMRDAKKWLCSDPTSFHLLLDKLTQASIEYLSMQVAAGAQAIQVFDSWANLLDSQEFEELSLRYLQRIVDAIDVPVILFCRGSSLRAHKLASIRPAAISFDWEGDLSAISHTLPQGIAVQGNLDPNLLRGDPEILRESVKRLLGSMRNHPGYICNLGHGILPDTPVENVQLLVEEVQMNRILG